AMVPVSVRSGSEDDSYQNRVSALFSDLATNEPDPEQRLRRVQQAMAGARLIGFYPVSTLIDGQGLNMTVQSYDGHLDFGFVADRELVPDLWVMTDLLREEMDDLVSLAQRRLDPPETKPVRKRAARR
ncbi:MAG: hypothetical protein RI900_618, partial [Actinomycetota bacterium]